MKSSDLTTRADQVQVGDSATASGLLGLFTSFLELGMTAFGGPAMIAYIRQMAVEKKVGFAPTRSMTASPFARRSLAPRRCRPRRMLACEYAVWLARQ